MRNASPRKMRKTRYYLVELINNTDRRDDEAIKVKASSPRSARTRAANAINTFRFSIGRVVVARGSKRRADRELASDLRMMCGGREI